MLTSFLFWNLNRKPLTGLVARLARLYELEVIVLVESTISHDHMVEVLNAGIGTWFHLSDSYCKAVSIYTRFSPQFLVRCSETSRMTIRRMNLPARKEIILVAAHLISKTHWSDESQSAECLELVREIRTVESSVGHERTMFIGDVNMNPFEAGLVSANGFNAVMARSVASRESRTVQGRSYPFFYNPMWSYFGDRGDSPPGTFYQARAEHVTYFWNMFDQVLLRPALLPSYRSGDISILTTDGVESFLTETGLPSTEVASDHLPVVVKLDL